MLKRIRGTDNVDVEYEDIVMAQQAAAMATDGSFWSPYRTLLSRQYRPQLIITVLVRLACFAHALERETCKLRGT